MMMSIKDIFANYIGICASFIILVLFIDRRFQYYIKENNLQIQTHLFFTISLTRMFNPVTVTGIFVIQCYKIIFLI